ncbi:MAG: hypothetical protein R6U35_01575, partial [Candidatus Humimicrobiaceae bacterium]
GREVRIGEGRDESFRLLEEWIARDEVDPRVAADVIECCACITVDEEVGVFAWNAKEMVIHVYMNWV